MPQSPLVTTERTHSFGHVLPEETDSALSPLGYGPYLDRALDAAHVGVWIWDRATGMSASRECWTLWGFGDERVDRFRWTTHVHPEDRERLTKSLQGAARDHGSLEDEYRIVLPDGRHRWIFFSGRAMHDVHVDRIVGICQDISERKDAERASAALAAIVENSDDAIVGKTLEGTIVSWNAAAERIFGYTATEAVGQNVTLIIPPDRQHEERAIISAVLSGNRVTHYESKRLTKDRRLIDVSLTVSPVRDADGCIIGASKIARDITEKKRAEQAAADSSRRKDLFLATLAHELRNPLAPIRNAVKILELKSPHYQPDVRKAVGIIDRQVDHLVHLVADLLDANRITLGKIELQRADLDIRDVAEEALTTSRPLLNERGHHVVLTTAPDSVCVYGDWVRLVQVVTNLLNNAANYTPTGGRVELEVRSEGAEAVVTVTDTGVGIPGDMLSSVFDLFVQVDRPSGIQGGLGIGLWLAKRIVEMHDGVLIAHSDGPGGGSRFTVRLPLFAQDSAPGRTAQRPAEDQPKRYRFLVVDDNVDGADSQAILLQMLGHEVWTAYDGETALVKAADVRPHVVLLDLGMPGTTGFSVGERMREIPGLSQVILIAQTGWGRAEDREKTAKAGFDAHLTKPVDIKALMAVLAAERSRLDAGQV